MRINHNISALNTNRLLAQNNGSTSKSLEKLSSGLAINRAGDNAAGLAISEKMRGQIRGLNQASSNANDGISLIQTAEGGLNETHSILQRMRELAVQSANDTNTDEDRTQIQKEIETLKEEVTRIADTTEFNGRKLLNGDLAAKITGQTLNAGTTNLATTDYTLTIPAGSAISEKADYTVTLTVDAANVTTASSATPTKYTPTNAGYTAGANGTENKTYYWNGEAWAEGAVNGSTTITTTALLAKANGSFGDDSKLNFGDRMVISTSAASTFTPTTASDLTATITGGQENKQTSATYTFSELTGKWSDGTTDYTTADLQTKEGLTIGGTPKHGDKIETKAAVMDGETSVKIDKITYNDGTSDIEIAADSFKFALTETGLANAALADGTATITVSVDPKYADGDIEKGALTFHIGANKDQNTKLTIGNMDSQSLGIQGINLNSQTGANDAISTLDDAIEIVSTQRAALGAMQNRLEHTINNLGTSSENLSAAESQIRDVDMAEEMSNYTKNNILVQAATAMLAQSNQQPQSVLSLLQG